MTGRWTLWLWAVIAVGLIARLIFGAVTVGSAFDIESYELAAEQLRSAPLDFYGALGGSVEGGVRYPYPPGFLPWILFAHELADLSGLPFHALVGLPAVFADGAIAWFVQDFLGRRGASPRTRLSAACLVAFGPVFAVASGHIPHPDSVAILPAVIALWLWDRDARREDDRRALAAGVLIGLGATVKTVPILMLFALLPSCRGRREGALLVAAALAVPLVVLAPFLLSTPRSTIETFGYAGVPGAGGLSLVIQPEMALRWLVEFKDLSRLGETLFENRTIWTAATTLFAAAFLFRHRTSAVLASVLIWLTVYITGTGFFFQYLVWGLPFFVMAGFLREAALLQAAVALPMFLFYNGPWEERFVALPYGAIMIAVWIGFLVALARLARREVTESTAEARRRKPLIASAVSALERLRGRDGPRAPMPSADGRRTLRVGLPAVLGALAAVSLVSIALLLAEARPGEVITGSDGPFAADQHTYLSWIADGGEAGLDDNDYSLAESAHVYTHPMFLISGVLESLGAGLQLSYLLWKPVAVALLFAGFMLYTRRLVRGAGAQLAAIVLALFSVSLAGPLTDWLGAARADEVAVATGEAFTSGVLWGYLPTSISVGLMPLFLLGLERGAVASRQTEGHGSRWYLGWTALAGAFAAWIHPWQGQVLLVVIAGLAIWGAPGLSRRALAVPAVATLAPIAYYAALSQLDPAWELAREANAQSPMLASNVLLVLAPLAIPAAFAFSRPGADAGQRMLRLWPAAALAVHFVLAPTTPSHALEGIALPLSVLAVQGWQLLVLPRALALSAIVLLTAPGLAWEVSALRDVIAARVQSHYLSADESRALELIRDDPSPGGVLATPYLGSLVPPFADRRVWVGHPSWTPDFAYRSSRADALFNGDLDRGRARALVAESRAAFLVSDCKRRADLRPLLGARIAGTVELGCATVYRLRAPRPRP